MRQSSQSKHYRSPSFQQDSSPSALTPNNDSLISRKVDNIDHYISKFDERIAKLENVSRSFHHDDRSSTTQKKMTEPGSSEMNYKPRTLEDTYALTRSEVSKRVQNTDDSSADLNRRASILTPKVVDTKEDDNARGNQRISAIEKRMDIIERRMDQLTSSFEKFMHRMESRAQVPERQNTRQERTTEQNESTPEVKGLGNDLNRRGKESPYTQKRPVSRDSTNYRDTTNHRDSDNPRETFDIRDRVREALEQVGRRKEERRTTNENERERSEGRRSLEVRVPPRELKGNLKSPDTERKRKNVSWSEMQSPDQDSFVESEHKRKRHDISGDIENLKMLMTDEHIKGKDRPRLNRSRERFEERLAAVEIPNQRESASKKADMISYEKYVAERTEARNNERMSASKEESNPVGKERQLEERRKKIDEEIERRIQKQIEVKKRAEVAVEGQKKVYEKNSVVEDDFKISPYSTEKSRDKEVVSRLVREKQMRNDLISKYSETTPDSSKKVERK